MGIFNVEWENMALMNRKYTFLLESLPSDDYDVSGIL